MGLQSCKPCCSCLTSKEECRVDSGCLRMCEDWRHCPDRCCDTCCQMCLSVFSGLCSGDCGYTFCTICLNLAQSCVLLFTSQQDQPSGSQQPSWSNCPSEEERLNQA